MRHEDRNTFPLYNLNTTVEQVILFSKLYCIIYVEMTMSPHRAAWHASMSPNSISCQIQISVKQLPEEVT